MDIWELMRQDRCGDAIRMASNAYARDEKSARVAINLAACLLWMRNWEGAYELFRHFTAIRPSTVDVAFKLAGTAKWCAGDKSAAVAEWKQGIDVDYADMGGGITIPLHLYFAAAFEPDVMPIGEAVDLLQSRLHAKPHDGWPGYLAKILLGQITCESAVAQSKGDLAGQSHLIDRS